MSGNSLRLIATFWIAACCWGCQPTTRDGKTTADKLQSAATGPAERQGDSMDNQPPPPLPEPIEVKANQSPWLPTERLPWESWYLQYIDGKRVGYSQVLVTQSTTASGSALSGENERIRIERTDYIEIERQGAKTRYERTTESIEYANGHLLTFWDTAKAGEAVTETEGKLIDGRLTLTIKQANQPRRTTVIQWEVGTWGLMGIQAILLKEPPQPGEVRKAQVFLPQLNKVASAEMLAGQPDITSLPGGKTELLLPIDVVLWTEDSGVRSRNWINAQGEILKTIALTGPNMSTFKAPEAIAHRARDEFAVADLLNRALPLRKFPADGEAIKRVVYEISRREARANAGELAKLFDRSSRQSVQSISALNAKVTVTAVASDVLPAESNDPGLPPELYLATSPLIPAEHPVVRQLALELIGDATGPEQAALKLAQGLRARTTWTEFDGEIDSPLRVARAGRGDCAEQAMLLCSLLRSQKIPARLASGWRVERDNFQSVRFHMWTEAWTDGRWLPLDVTSGQIAGIDLIKLLDHALEGENPYIAILPVLEAMEGLEIVVQDYD